MNPGLVEVTVLEHVNRTRAQPTLANDKNNFLDFTITLKISLICPYHFLSRGFLQK